jgi:hypothetical protein
LSFEHAIKRALKFPYETNRAMAALEYKGLELVILSRPFKTKELAEKAHQKYPDGIARKIGIGVVRVKA